MKNPAATTRIGVLACTRRTQEYVRRILRSMGYAPLVFANVQELAALGPNASKLRMLVAGGHSTDIAARDRKFLASIRAAIGERVPLLYCPLGNAPRAMYRGIADGVVPDSSQYASDLCLALRGFLESYGLRGLQPSLHWGGYAFRLLHGSVTFADREVRLAPLSFDTALELFYNAGQTVAPSCLASVLPIGRARPTNPSFSRIVHDLKVSLELGCGHGWDLAIMPGDHYRLFRAAGCEALHAAGSWPGHGKTLQRDRAAAQPV